MNINIELTEADLKKLVEAKVKELMPDISLESYQINIKVKSKQNYKSEWEEAAFRATVVYNQ